MRWRISIEDTETGGLVAEERFSERDSIVLEKVGSDEKIQDIVASEFQFTLIDTTNQEGVFSSLYTSNENRFKITITNVDTSEVAFVGFLLPETFSEPFKYKYITGSFSAICGLGLLDGKYFDASFYEDEHDVITILTTALSKTGLSLDLNFAPGIVPRYESDFKKVTKDMKQYYDSDKNKYTSIYEVVKEILVSLGSILYQESGEWWFVGYNQRFRLKYNSKKYNSSGVLLSSDEIERERVVANPLAFPEITIDPKVRSVEISKKEVEFGFPEGVDQIEEPGIVGEISVNRNLFATSWIQNNDVAPLIHINDLLVRIPVRFHATQTYLSTDYISLYQKVFVREGMKLRFKLEMKIESDTTDATLLEGYVNDGTFSNPILYDLRLNDTSVISNGFGDNQLQQGWLKFNKEKTAKAEYTFITQDSGVIDLRIYQPYRTTFIPFKSFEFTKVLIEEIGEPSKNSIYTEVVDENYSKQIEIEVPIADDIDASASSFRLQKYREFDTTYESVSVDVLYSFQENSDNYAVVSLYDAMLIDRDRSSLYNGAAPVTVEDVIYNYNNGEQMVIKTSTLISSGTSLTVRVYPYTVDIDKVRQSEVYTDALYQIETLPFIKAYAKMISRLYNGDSLVINATFQKKIGFNTLVNFKFDGVKDFYVTNCSYNATRNETTVVLHQCLYDGGVSVSVPPFVNAGEDVSISDVATAANLTATAFDPDGTIASVLWSQVSPVSPLATIASSNSLSTGLSGLSQDVYTFKIVATDNDGLTAEDEVKVIRNKEYALTLTQSYTYSDSTTAEIETREYDLSFSPTVLEGVVLNLCIESLLESDATGDGSADAQLIINKNGFDVFNKTAQNGEDIEESFTVSFIPGDIISFRIHVVGSFDAAGTYSARSRFNIKGTEFISGVGTVTGVPVNKELNISG